MSAVAIAECNSANEKKEEIYSEKQYERPLDNPRTTCHHSPVMKIQFKAFNGTVNKDFYLYDEENNPLICFGAIRECKVFPAETYLCSISTKPMKGSIKYKLERQKTYSNDEIISYRGGNYIFEALQILLLPLFGAKTEVNVYFLAENIRVFP